MKRIIPYILGIALIYTTYLMVENSNSAVEKASNTQGITNIPKTEEVAKLADPAIKKPIETPVGSVHLPILMYHYIRTATNFRDPVGIDLSVPADAFEEQMKYIVSTGYETVTLDDLVATWKGEKVLPKKPIILTFDDGYDDFYSTALPILKKYNLKATVYVITGFIDKPHYLTSEQLKELDQSPLITIAAHTMHHPNLKMLTGSKLTDEILGSKTWLEKFTGHPILHFAYPSGQYNKQTIKAITDAGYATVVTTLPGEIHASSSPFTITRVRIHGAITLQAFKKLLP